MKKYLILIVIILLSSGCFDYQELNNRAIISGISVDYNNDNYEITMEILTSQKSENQNSENSKTYYIDGEANTIPEAFQKANLKLAKEPYYSHLKVVILSEQIAKEKLDHVLDYFVRDPSIRNIFIPIVAKDCEAKTLLKNNSKENSVVSESIQRMIETNSMTDQVRVPINFQNFLDSIISPYKDAYLNTISIKDENLYLSGLAIFKGQKMQTILNTEDTVTFNVLQNNAQNYYVKLACPKKENAYTTIDFYDNNKTSIEVKDNKLSIKSNLNGSVISDECGYDFRDPQSYQILNEQATPYIEKQFDKVLTKIQQYQTDILAINENNYKKKKQPITNWFDYEKTYQINININKNGLVFEVN